MELSLGLIDKGTLPVLGSGRPMGRTRAMERAGSCSRSNRLEVWWWCSNIMTTMLLGANSTMVSITTGVTTAITAGITTIVCSGVGREVTAVWTLLFFSSFAARDVRVPILHASSAFEQLRGVAITASAMGPPGL